MKALKQSADEQALVEAAQRDPQRFAELYERNFHCVYAFVARRVRNREEAEDVTSEVFHQGLAKIKLFEWRGAPFAAWLMRIAANTIADRWKRLSRESKADVPYDLDDIEDANWNDIERQAALSQLVGKLPDDQRQVILLRFVEQKNIRDVARQINRTEGAVKQLQFRALQSLRASREGANG